MQRRDGYFVRVSWLEPSAQQQAQAIFLHEILTWRFGQSDQSMYRPDPPQEMAVSI